MNRLRTLWRQRVAHWLARRIPPAPSLTLGYRTLFILPTPLGYQYLLLVATLFVLGTNYQNNLILALAYLLLSLFLTTLLYCHQNLVGLELKALPATPRFVGESASFEVALSTQTPRYALQLMPHRASASRSWVSRQLLKQPERRQRPRLLLHEQLPLLTEQGKLCVTLHPWRRGWLQAGRLEISSRYPLGLFKCWSLVDLQLATLIYPSPQACHMQPLVSDPGDKTPQSGNKAHDDIPHLQTRAHSHNVEELSGLRPHKPGEAMSLIAWKQVAQGRGMVSKEFATEERAACWLSLAQAPGHSLEEQLSALCYQVQELSKQGQLFGLRLSEVRLAPGTGADHQRQALQHLATYRSEPYVG